MMNEHTFQIGDIVQHNYSQMYGFITNITIFKNRTFYSVIWFGYGDEPYDEFEQRDLVKVTSNEIPNW